MCTTVYKASLGCIGSSGQPGLLSETLQKKKKKKRKPFWKSEALVHSSSKALFHFCRASQVRRRDKLSYLYLTFAGPSLASGFNFNVWLQFNSKVVLLKMSGDEMLSHREKGRAE